MFVFYLFFITYGKLMFFLLLQIRTDIINLFDSLQQTSFFFVIKKPLTTNFFLLPKTLQQKKKHMWKQLALIAAVILVLKFFQGFTNLREGYYPWWRQRLPWWRRRWGRNWWYDPYPPVYYSRYGYFPYYSYY